ncbi:MAG: L-dopachrome tautomerase-related protein, partial [Shewanella sp.]
MAYPSQAINNDKFIAVQSVVADDLDRLWVLDTGNPQFKGVISGRAKLFLIDPKTNQISKEYVCPADVALAGSYLNDVRVDTKRNFAYLTDSTIGGIVVLDLNTGKSWRALDSSVKAVQAKYDRLQFPTTGEWFNKVASDGIELSADGQEIYFTALTGDVLYQIPTADLRDQTLSVAQRAQKVVTLNSQNVPTDGMVLHNEQLIMGDLPNESLWVYDLNKKQGHNIHLGYPVRWADSLDTDKDGAIYFTTSQINYPIDQRGTYKIIKIEKATNSALYQPVAEQNIERNLTPLHKAVISGDIKQVQSLIEQGADVNSLDKLMGVAPLHIAVQRHNLDMVRLLVDNGAFINLQSVRLGGTPLLLA